MEATLLFSLQVAKASCGSLSRGFGVLLYWRTAIFICSFYPGHLLIRRETFIYPVIALQAGGKRFSGHCCRRHRRRRCCCCLMTILRLNRRFLCVRTESYRSEFLARYESSIIYRGSHLKMPRISPEIMYELAASLALLSAPALADKRETWFLKLSIASHY